MSMKFGRSKVAIVAVVVGLSALTGCDESSPEAGAGMRAGSAEPVLGEAEQAAPDARLQTHEIVASTPTTAGLAYIQAVAAAHREADTQQGDARMAALEAALDLPVPSGLPEAEILRLEVASRIASEWIDRGSADKARALLVPMLEPARSVPLDRSSAEALVLLGDAATRTGDDALAAGSYARSIRMMSILRQEIER
ncbi:MAG: hypothetical protein ACRBN8_35025 [Nannocystales bacterium]